MKNQLNEMIAKLQSNPLMKVTSGTDNKLDREKLQKMIEKFEQMNDSFYYLTCMYDDPGEKQGSLSFKILIKLSNETTTIKLPQNTNEPNKANNPTSPTNSDPSLNRYNQQKAQPIMQGSHKEIYLDQLNRQPATLMPSVEQVVVTNQMKINTYYSFSQSCFQYREDLIETLIQQFNQQLNSLVNSVYLTLTLREIHETRKWNNLLVLKENNLNVNLNSSEEVNEQMSKGNSSMNNQNANSESTCNETK